MNTKLTALALGAALTLTSALANADHGRHGDWNGRDGRNRDRAEHHYDHDGWNRDRAERRYDHPRAWGRIDGHHHRFHHHPPQHRNHHRFHHRHDRWCGHWAPRSYAPRWSSYDYEPAYSTGSITFILRSDLN